MNILLAYDGLLPALNYGGVERVIWGLAKFLNQKGHQVTLLASQGSHCPYAKVIGYNPELPFSEQIPNEIDLVHSHLPYKPSQDFNKPLLITLHGNAKPHETLHPNTVFLCGDHAKRHGGTHFVFNGLNWDDYPTPNLTKTGHNFHFLGKAAWRVKNLKGAIKTVLQTPNGQLHVVGGNRVNFKMGFRLTLSPRVKFYGTVGGEEKFAVLNQSRGLIFPVLWDEPFGLAIIESLYFGCPVFATPYGSLTELVTQDVGLLSAHSQTLSAALQDNRFHPNTCHQYARDVFDAERMTENYLKLYDKILNNQRLHNQPLGLIKPSSKKDYLFD